MILAINMYADQIKFTFLGDVGTGKTSIISQFSTQTFELSPASTIGASNVIKSITHNQQTFTLSIWDTAGQEKYKSISKMLYRDAQVIAIVFDVSKHSTFLSVESWHKSVIEISGPNVIIFIIGNKIDLFEELHQISTEECEKLAIKLNCPLLFVSAKSGLNIDHLFKEAVKMVSAQKNVSQNRKSSKLSTVFDSNSLREYNKRKSCCSH